MYSLKIHKKALNFLNSQTPTVKKNIRQKLNLLKENPYTHQQLDVKKLIDNQDYWRLRIGSIRIIYKTNEGELTILAANAGSRGKVYKKKK